MAVIDNKGKKFKDELKEKIVEGDKISILASSFTLTAFSILKEELSKIDKLKFIFKDSASCSSIYGKEIKLCNEMKQKAISRECAEWVKERAIFKSNISSDPIEMSLLVSNNACYSPVNRFDSYTLGEEKAKTSICLINDVTPDNVIYRETFKELWNNYEDFKEVTEDVLSYLEYGYKENSPEFIYYLSICNIFSEFLKDSENEIKSEDNSLKESKIWSLLYDFQKDAAIAIINKLNKYNGCILADSVGLGKTFTALAVIKYYESMNKNVLVLCPKKLGNNWNTYNANYTNNILSSDRFRYDVLYHTDLGREYGESNGTDLTRFNWKSYDLIVIDESHNFRNGGSIREDGKMNRYSVLMEKVIKEGVKTKVLMLSATPVNNRFNDLKQQLALIYEGDTNLIDNKLKLGKGIDEIFREAQTTFNIWSKKSREERTTNALVNSLSPEFFSLLDEVTIARSRKNIEKYYDTNDIGEFPLRLAPISLSPNLTDMEGAWSYKKIYEVLVSLNLNIYHPSYFIHPSRRAYYATLLGDNKVNVNFTQDNRENGIRRLMAINLMKRLESSVNSFELTVRRILSLITSTIEQIDRKAKEVSLGEIKEDDFDSDDEADIFSISKKIQFNLSDMDTISWRAELISDKLSLEELLRHIDEITPEYDKKLQVLLEAIERKITSPINDNNKKIIIFTAFSDTAEYLYSVIAPFIKEKYGLNSALVTGKKEGKTTLDNVKTNINTILTLFSPISKDRDLVLPGVSDDIDILIATDCISEGQNLQDADCVINYDIHWNPVRIIQRFGRVDRLGSRNKKVQLISFWPDISLDDYIKLKQKVETKMKALNISATGDDDIFSIEEQNDLEYRQEQLKRLKEEVCDIEDMSGGVSIMDFGLNEVRLDAYEYKKRNKSILSYPVGLYSITESNDYPTGVIFVLKSLNKEKEKFTRLWPYYIIYVLDNGEIYLDSTKSKEALDVFRYLARGKKDINSMLISLFDKETRKERNMQKYTTLFNKALDSIIEKKEEENMFSFLKGEDTSFIEKTTNTNFRLISFLVVKGRSNA